MQRADKEVTTACAVLKQLTIDVKNAMNDMPDPTAEQLDSTTTYNIIMINVHLGLVYYRMSNKRLVILGLGVLLVACMVFAGVAGSNDDLLLAKKSKHSGGGSKSGGSGSGSNSGGGSSDKGNGGSSGSGSGSNDNGDKGSEGPSKETPKVEPNTPDQGNTGNEPASPVIQLPPLTTTPTEPVNPGPPANCMAIGCPGSPPQTPTTPAPTDKCAFNPDSPNCKPDPITGKCPPGFSHNVHDNCFPSGPCPSGFGRHDNDESGKCFPTPIHCPPGFFPKHGVCTKDIFINIHNVIHSSSSGSHSLSSGCYDAIKIAWLSKIERSRNQEVDSFIDNCLGVH
ncbi:MAG: hypothetical protein ACTHKP_04520 [Nitrososphaeraceae archaeon]